MLGKKPDFLNFTVDHMTMILRPEMYKVAYVIFRNVLGVTPDDLIYEKRKEWQPGQGEQSMTFAASLGNATATKTDKANSFDKTIIAVVQPTEPKNQKSHVRKMLGDHSAAVHWQHIALRCPDLLAFHEHALARGVNFITPLLRDEDEDVIQVFTGEWFYPGSTPSAVFFEFVQRNPTDTMLQRLSERNRETLFRDKTFLGLYAEKEAEYQFNNVTPFVDFELQDQLNEYIGERHLYEITEDDIQVMDNMMLEYAKNKKENVLPSEKNSTRPHVS